MTSLTCNRGCKHEERWCLSSIEHEGCDKCERDEEPTCDVGRFMFDNFADCQRRFSLHSCGHLTGFTRRTHAALVHLGDAANVADDTNRPGVLAAIAALLTCRSIREEEHFARKMIDSDEAWRDATSRDDYGETDELRETLRVVLEMRGATFAAIASALREVERRLLDAGTANLRHDAFGDIHAMRNELLRIRVDVLTAASAVAAVAAMVEQPLTQLDGAL